MKMCRYFHSYILRTTPKNDDFNTILELWWYDKIVERRMSWIWMFSGAENGITPCFTI
jgi:hypothetical protein